MKLQLFKFFVALSCQVLVIDAHGSFAAEFFEIVDPQTGPSFFIYSTVSDNGVVGGEAQSGIPEVTEAIRWTRDGGIKHLGFLDPEQPRLSSSVRGITADGSAILIWQRRNLAEHGYSFLWSEEGGYTDLSTDDIDLYRISADGSLFGGRQTQPDGTSRAVLRGPNGVTDIGVLPGMDSSSIKSISADASVAVGWSYLDEGSKTSDFYWTNGTGIQPLQPYPGAEDTVVRVLSADGTVAIGAADSAEGHRIAVAWLSNSEGRFDDAPMVLPIVEGTVSNAYHVSSDGSVIFGRVTNGGTTCPCSSVVWLDQQETMTFEDWLIQEHQLGDAISGWDFDEFPPMVGSVGGRGDISNNDRFLVGEANNPSGARSTFVIDFGSPVGDFDDSGLLDAADINLLTDQVVRGNHASDYDLDGDGLVNQEDRRVWIEDLANAFFGDANLDQAVGFDDFLELSSGFGELGDWGNGDFDGSGVVAFPDFLLLAQNFGNTSVAAATVPEPGALTMLFSIGLLALISRRGRQ